MGRPKKTVIDMVLRGNPSKLSREQLQVRAKQEAAASVGEVFNGKAIRPRLPKHLCAEAVVVWRNTVRLMRQRGTISAGDVPALELYAEISARWQAAKADLNKRGIIVQQVRRDKQGNTYTVDAQNECLAICQDCERQLLSLAKALGLTPDTRGRVEPTKQDNAGVAQPGTVAALFPEMFKK